MIRVTSEVGRLRRLLVHEPGPEIDHMVPAMMEQLLFDDILYGNRAREEHAVFRRVLQLLGVEVVEASSLLETILELAEARSWLMGVVLEDLPLAFKHRIEELDSRDLARALVCGVRSAEPHAGVEVEDLFSLSPLPNWCFQRDPQAVLGHGIVFASMAADARRRESVLARALFRFHPDLSSAPVIFDPLETEGHRPLLITRDFPTLEGGDVLVLSEDVLLVGHSERTNRTAIRSLARALARREGSPRWLVVLALPRRRAYMHLDTLLTPVDRDACLVYPPVILSDGPEHARLFEADLHAGELSFSSRASLMPTLARHGIDFDPIPCGGDDRVDQQREQWSDGANALALAPGIITLYDRNVRTADTLAERGFRVVNAEDLLLGKAELRLDEPRRACVLLPSHEISRARGGPHCLSHPLLRDEPA